MAPAEANWNPIRCSYTVLTNKIIYKGAKQIYFPIQFN